MSVVVESPIASFSPVYSGLDKLSGTLKEAGTPDVPVVRTVAIFGEQKGDGSLKCVRLNFLKKTVSDASGNWSFDNLNKEKKYTVIGYDSSGEYAPAIGAGLVCDT